MSRRSFSSTSVQRHNRLQTTLLGRSDIIPERSSSDLGRCCVSNAGQQPRAGTAGRVGGLRRGRRGDAVQQQGEGGGEDREDHRECRECHPQHFGPLGFARTTCVAVGVLNHGWAGEARDQSRADGGRAQPSRRSQRRSRIGCRARGTPSHCSLPSLVVCTTILVVSDR